jgi:hypothetical protein
MLTQAETLHLIRASILHLRCVTVDGINPTHMLGRHVGSMMWHVWDIRQEPWKHLGEARSYERAAGKVHGKREYEQKLWWPVKKERGAW